MAEAKLAGMPYDAPGVFRFNLAGLVEKVIADVFNARESDGSEIWPTDYSKRSAVFGTLHVAIRRIWHE
jgi:hypothetical protein